MPVVIKRMSHAIQKSSYVFHVIIARRCELGESRVDRLIVLVSPTEIEDKPRDNDQLYTAQRSTRQCPDVSRAR